MICFPTGPSPLATRFGLIASHSSTVLIPASQTVPQTPQVVQLYVSSVKTFISSSERGLPPKSFALRLWFFAKSSLHLAFLYMGVMPGLSGLTANVGHHFIHSWHLLQPSTSRSWVDNMKPVIKGLELLLISHFILLLCLPEGS